MEKIFKIKKNKAVTLIEILLYISIVVIIVLAISSIWTITNESRIKNESINKVNHNGQAIMQLLSSTINEASGVNDLSSGDEGNQLSLNMRSPDTGTTIFSVSDGVLQITEGSNNSLNLTDNSVTLNDFTVKNMARPGTLPLLRIMFTIETNTTETALEQFYFSNDFISSFAIK